MQFPASWFGFCAEIPLFLSDFAETTIAPLPVLVTVTPLTPSLSSSVQFHRLWSGRGEFRAETRSTGESGTNVEFEETSFCLTKQKFHGKKKKKKASTACQAVGTLEKTWVVAGYTVKTCVLDTVAVLWGQKSEATGTTTGRVTFHRGRGEGCGVKGQVFTATLSKQSVSCVFSVRIIMLTIIMVILKGDITVFEIHRHLQVRWLGWRAVEPPGHGSRVELQAGGTDPSRRLPSSSLWVQI